MMRNKRTDAAFGKGEDLEDSIMKKLAESLTAETTEIISFLPCLLQDLEELGSCPHEMAEMVAGHIKPEAEMTVLDLACGKGAISLRQALQFGGRTIGVDLLPELIERARQKAVQLGLSVRYSFEVGDVNQAVKEMRGFDCVIWGAAGNLPGSCEQTLTRLTAVVRDGGYLLFEDSYVECAADRKTSASSATSRRVRSGSCFLNAPG